MDKVMLGRYFQKFMCNLREKWEVISQFHILSSLQAAVFDNLSGIESTFMSPFWTLNEESGLHHERNSLTVY